MATLDFAPLYRSTIGFDRLPLLLSHALERDEGGYPPYNIEKVGEDDYRIEIAIAGFAKDDVEIIAEQNRLTIRGHQVPNDGETYLYRGIAARSFERRFELADHVEVTGAVLASGLLTIDLKREVPDALKPRRIEIGSRKASQIGQRKPQQSAA
jgi:molecular chaperone IbpA